MIDFSSLAFWKLALSLLFIAILGKVLAGFLIKASLKEKLLIGFSMLPRGEVGLIFAEIGKNAKLFNDLIYAVIIFVVAFTTLIAPLVLKMLVKE
jgi:Kef-type K+ transport system membrane component KefB